MAAAGEIRCCLCGVSIPPNPTAMCEACVAQEFDITSAIPRSGTVTQCRKCGRWETHNRHWLRAERESGELLAMCLKKITGGLGRGPVRLRDAGWVWTEPHSRRLKIWLEVQGEVDSGATLRQKVTVELKENWRQCDECSREFTGGTWKALVQLRQKAEHKRSMLFLEQRLIQAGFERLSLDISPVKGGGLDFYFADKSIANAFVQFIGALVPVKTRFSKKLVGMDTHSNIPRHQHTISAEIAATCKDDLVLPTKKASAALGPCLPLVKRVTSQIKLINPSTGVEMDISSESYWKKPLFTVLNASFLTDFIVLDVEPYNRRRPGREGNQHFSSHTVMAEAVVARTSDFGSNDETFTVVTHLGGVLHDGDTALGYDLSNIVLPDDVRENIARAFGSIEPPDVILVKKKRDRGEGKSKRRKRRLKRFYETEPDTLTSTVEEGSEASSVKPGIAEAKGDVNAPIADGKNGQEPQMSSRSVSFTRRVMIADEEPGAERAGKRRGRRGKRQTKDNDEKDMEDFLEYLEHDDEMAAQLGLIPAAPVEAGEALPRPPVPEEDEATRIAREAMEKFSVDSRKQAAIQASSQKSSILEVSPADFPAAPVEALGVEPTQDEPTSFYDDDNDDDNEDDGDDKDEDGSIDGPQEDQEAAHSSDRKDGTSHVTGDKLF